MKRIKLVELPMQQKELSSEEMKQVRGGLVDVNVNAVKVHLHHLVHNNRIKIGKIDVV